MKSLGMYYEKNMPFIIPVISREIPLKVMADILNTTVPTWKCGRKWSESTVCRLRKQWQTNPAWYRSYYLKDEV